METSNLIFTLQTFDYFEASCLAMDTLCNFHDNQDISRLAIQLCANLCLKVSWYSRQILKKIALLDRFFAQLDTQILEKQEKHSLFKMSAVNNSRGNANKSLDHAMSVSEQLHTYPSSNPTLTCHQLAVGG